MDPKGVVTYSDRPPQLTPVEGERDALIEEALTISGIKRQIEDLPEQARAGADASQAQLPPKERAALAKIIGAAFRSGPILTTVRSAFQKSYDPTQMGLLLAQLRTPTARKMAVLEGAGSEPDVVAKLQTFAAGLKDAPPAEDRVARLVRLDAATGTTDLVIEMRAASIAAAFKVLSALMPPEKRLPPARMNAAVRNLVGQQRETARREILVLFLFIYREATDAELDEYIGIGSSESGRWFQTIYRRGLAEAITTATETAIRQVAKSFRPEPL